MDDVKFELLKLQIKDRLSFAKYGIEVNTNCVSDVLLGKFLAYKDVVELLEDDKWK